MDKGNASWEQVHRILFPGGPVPASLLDATGSSHPGAGLLGPPPKNHPHHPFEEFTSSMQGGGLRPPLSMPLQRPPPPALTDPRLAHRRGDEEGFQRRGEESSQREGNFQRRSEESFQRKGDESFQKRGGPEDSLHFFAIPPPVPRDPKVLHHIRLFAAFVAKFGIESESVARAKQHGKSEFSFLFGGEPGSDASIGRHYYEWQKQVMLKVLEARKAVSEGKIPPDRLRLMQRELEQCLQGVQTLKDLRIEAIIGLPENGKLDWQKIAVEVGLTLPGERRPSYVEQPEDKPATKADKLATKAQPVKPAATVPLDPRRSVQADRTRAGPGPGRKDDKEVEEFSSPGNRRRRRSRSRSQERDRHRYQRSPPRSPSHRNHSPRRRGRSRSRSPRRRERYPSPRRAKREAEERKDDDNNSNNNNNTNKFAHHYHQPGHSLQQESLLETLPFPNQHVVMVPQAAPGMEHPPGFTDAGRYIAPPLLESQAPPLLVPLQQQQQQQQHQQQHSFPSSSQDAGLLRLPPGTYPQVGGGAPFAPPNLSELPVQQQQFFLQQLQLSQMQNQLGNGPLGPPPLPPPSWPACSDVLPLEVEAPQHFSGLVPPAPAMFLPQPQQQQVVSADKYDPLQPTTSNDVEMEVENGSPKAADEEPEVVNSKVDGAVAAETSSKRASETTTTSGREKSGKDKERDRDKDHRKEEDGGEEAERAHKERSEKDGRALKVVRNTVAEFVKELLNPKWRDGILSKDDFKVIAQKAVNKVVGNLQGSQIPKGTDRVDRFMASSKDKIVKLVQEYVDKHTKNAPAPAPTPATAPSNTDEDDEAS